MTVTLLLGTGTSGDAEGDIFLNIEGLVGSGAQDTVGTGVDTLTSIENLTGSDFDDQLTGNDAANVLNGLVGNDRIDGAGGTDTLVGCAGDDILIGGAGGDILDGGEEFDFVIYETIAEPAPVPQPRGH